MFDKDTINVERGQRIRERRKSLGMTGQELADRLTQETGQPVTRQALTNWETGRNAPKGKNKDVLAALLNTTADWLDWGDRPAQPELHPIFDVDRDGKPKEEGYVLIPRLAISPSCGAGAITWEEDREQDPFVFPKVWADALNITDFKNIYMTGSRGLSMAGKIWEFDNLIVRIHNDGDPIIDNRVYMFCLDGMVFAKRFRKNFATGGYTIISDNEDKAAYPDQEISRERLNDVRFIAQILGRFGPV